MYLSFIYLYPIGGSREGAGVRTPPLKNHKNEGFLSNTGPDPLENHKATKPAFNVGPSSARQRHLNGFRWRADDLFIQYLKRCTLLAEIAILPSGPL